MKKIAGLLNQVMSVVDPHEISKSIDSENAVKLHDESEKHEATKKKLEEMEQKSKEYKKTIGKIRISPM